MSDDIVTVARFLNVVQADLAKAELQLAGIEAFVLDANAPYTAQEGAIQLQVRESDEARALEVLKGVDADPGE